MAENNITKQKSTVQNEVDRAFDFLRDKTINFGFEPGVRINEVKLASTLGMSRAPVREALNRLVAMELVVFKPRQGFFCRKLSIVEVAELFEIRSDLELSALRSVCKNASNEDIANLYEKWKAIEKDQSLMSINSLIDVDETFHMELLTLANNAERVKFMKNINERIRFVRKINIENETRRLKFVDEHTKIMEAIMERDSAKAISLMEYHLGIDSKDLKSNIREGLERIYGEEVGL